MAKEDGIPVADSITQQLYVIECYHAYARM